MDACGAASSVRTIVFSLRPTLRQMTDIPALLLLLLQALRGLKNRGLFTKLKENIAGAATANHEQLGCLDLKKVPREKGRLGAVRHVAGRLGLVRLSRQSGNPERHSAVVLDDTAKAPQKTTDNGKDPMQCHSESASSSQPLGRPWSSPYRAILGRHPGWPWGSNC